MVRAISKKSLPALIPTMLPMEEAEVVVEAVVVVEAAAAEVEEGVAAEAAPVEEALEVSSSPLILSKKPHSESVETTPHGGWKSKEPVRVTTGNSSPLVLNTDSGRISPTSCGTTIITRSRSTTPAHGRKTTRRGTAGRPDQRPRLVLFPIHVTYWSFLYFRA